MTALLGEPSYELENNDGLVYRNLGILCNFEPETRRLSSVELKPSYGFTLAGEQLPVELPALIEVLGVHGVRLKSEEGDSTLYLDDKWHVMVFMEDGVVDSIVFGVLYDDAGDNIQWPDRE
ncbi:MAG: hypothetical protein AAFQ65_13155 [Myxococcota bacterium]